MKALGYVRAVMRSNLMLVVKHYDKMSETESKITKHTEVLSPSMAKDSIQVSDALLENLAKRPLPGFVHYIPNPAIRRAHDNGVKSHAAANSGAIQAYGEQRRR